MSRFHGIAIAAGLGLLAGCAAPSKDMLEAHLGTSIPTLKPICAGSISPKGDPDRCEPSVGTRPWTAAKREFPFTLDVATARKEALESTGSAATEEPSEKAFGERLAQRIANAYLLKSFTADSGVDFACAGTTSALPPTLPQQFAHNSVSIRKVASEKLEVELSAAIESSSKALNLAISGETKLKLAAELSRRLEASSTTKGRLYWHPHLLGSHASESGREGVRTLLRAGRCRRKPHCRRERVRALGVRRELRLALEQRRQSISRGRGRDGYRGPAALRQADQLDP